MSTPFEIRREIEIPGDPEAVWQAVSTGAGTAGWMFPTGEGAIAAEGEVWMGHAVVAFDPPHHLALRMEADDGGVRNALDYRIERTGSGALLRYVHSGMIDDDWDTQYDGASRHTDFYLHSLGEYVAHFAGRPVVYVGASGPADRTDPAALDAVRRALGLTAASGVGDHVRVQVPGAGPLDGRVDYLDDMFVGIRGEDALYRFYGRGRMGMPVFAGHHLFSPEADGAVQTAAWEAWLGAAMAG